MATQVGRLELESLGVEWDTWHLDTSLQIDDFAWEKLGTMSEIEPIAMNPPLEPKKKTGSSMWDTDSAGGDDPSEDAGGGGIGADDALYKSPLLQRYPSLVPLRRHATSIAAVAFLVPSSTCDSRRATLPAAVFNMTATIIGGGVLSIPLSCARAGLGPFTALMAASAVATDFSLYVLVSCSRRCGSTSFGGVARSAFGGRAELLTTAAVLVVVSFSVIGLMKLNQGIWSPVLMMALGILIGGEGAPAGDTTDLQDAAVLLGLLVLMTPFLLKRDLTSLRHLCYVGFFSIAILCAAMAYRAAELNVGTDVFATDAKWTSTSLPEALSALPIIMCAYLCSFNIISVSCSLVRPTRERVRGVIHWAVALSFLIMYLFGVAGYLCAYDETSGNILRNFSPDDPIILLGRVSCGIMTLFALPMNTLPAREALLSAAAQVSEARASSNQSASLAERRVLLRKAGNHSSIDSAREDNFSYGTEDAAEISKTSLSRKEEYIHCLATFGIVFLCYVAAVLAPGVAIVWDISGSSMVFLIQFIIPAACYIKLKLRSRPDEISKNLVFAWCLLAFASVMALLCTSLTALRLCGIIK